MLVFLSRSVLSATLLGHWRQQHLKGTAFRSRFLLDLAHVLGVGNDTFEDAQPAILMDDFTPTEENRHFNAVSILKESLDMPDLGLEIVVVGLISLICTTVWRFLASCFFFCVSYLNLP